MVAISFSLPVDSVSDLSEDTFGERSFMGFIFIKVLPLDSVGSKFLVIEAAGFLKEYAILHLQDVKQFFQTFRASEFRKPCSKKRRMP